MSNKNSQKGFTILVAVVTASILLMIAMSIGGIALKEQVLSTANKESQIAFYAADTGMECALYWDVKKGVFAPTTDAYGSNNQSDILPISCNGSASSVSLATDCFINNHNYTYCYTFMVSGIPVGSGVPTCSVVKISKDTSNANKTVTYIQAYGYNTCAASLTRLERGIETTY